MDKIIWINEKYQDLNPTQFGYSQCKPLHFFGPTVRTYWVIHFVISGHGRFRINDKEYILGENDIFIIPPYEETYYEADEAEPWTYIWLNFTINENLPLQLPDVMHRPELRNIFLSMKNYEKYENSQNIFLCSKLWELYAHLQQATKPQTNYIDNALMYINYQYMNNITVDSIAKYLKLERSYFSALFKKHTGLSPKQYLLNYRMKIAADLLTKNITTISVIANSVGYTDIYNFSRMFKKHFGVSPNAYKKLQSKTTKSNKQTNINL